MKKQILLISILILVNFSCKKTFSSTNYLGVSEGNDVIFYYSVCKDEAFCKFSCDSTKIKSLSQKNLESACKKLEAALTASQLSSTNNKFTPETMKIINAMTDRDTLKIIDKNDKNFKNIDHLISNIGSCEEDNDEACAICQECPSSIPGALEGLWKTVELTSSSDFIYQNTVTEHPLENFQWSKSMGKMSYTKALETCNSYNFNPDSKYSKWMLPTAEQLKAASEFWLGEELNLNQKDLVWSLSEKDSDSSTEVISLIKDYDEDVYTETVSKTVNTYETICVRVHN